MTVRSLPTNGASTTAPPDLRGETEEADVIDANTLLDDLVRPTKEMQRVIGAVADGDLSKKISLDAQGEMLRLAHALQADATATRAVRAPIAAANRIGAVIDILEPRVGRILVVDEGECLAAGIDAYLSKPVKAATLVAMVNRWLPYRETQSA